MVLLNLKTNYSWLIICLITEALNEVSVSAFISIESQVLLYKLHKRAITVLAPKTVFLIGGANREIGFVGCRYGILKFILSNKFRQSFVSQQFL